MTSPGVCSALLTAAFSGTIMSTLISLPPLLQNRSVSGSRGRNSVFLQGL
ncbi:hypothetical protein AAFF_G00061760 [Aldrovandia affinis]|uniref:Uncharacterized protein n=1 Tax=Aldrovandia affinis TaxID=143900 RepID=A0AAD7VY43_9TELE|nr:hypothetical protein AAFF_G00061760 [Aldrovandia affinis]